MCIRDRRKSDPELENEFLRRLMLKLGATEAQAQAAVATAAPVQTAARVTTANNLPQIQLDDGFDRAWRRVGLSLDRNGFTVEDRDRTQGVYFVRFVADAKPASEPGFFARLFGNDKPVSAPAKYRVQVRNTGDNSSTVSVLDANGQPDGSAAAQRIVQVLAQDL